MHIDNSFITLTYDDDHLPSDGSLRAADLQKFFKRLRKSLSPHKIRFYGCGEYGEQFKRPHYHAIIFGYDFPDKEFHSKENGNPIFHSPELAKIWPFGFNTVGHVSYESAAYVARYVTKK